METPTGGTIELPVVLRFVEVATDTLAEAREEIDALNVYPVPDGDTGTNMYLTVTAAREAITEAVAQGADFAQALAAFGRGALLGARGNSGVILSQMLGAIGKRLAARAPDERNAIVVAEALRDATTASYAAVGQPVEGTMLSVAAAAATRAGGPPPGGPRRPPAPPGPGRRARPRGCGRRRPPPPPRRSTPATRTHAPATCSPPRRQPPARPWPGHPSSSRSWPTRAWSMPVVGAGA